MPFAQAGYTEGVAFSLRATANARFEIKDDDRKVLIGVAFGRKAGELIVKALNAYCGPGEQMELFDKAA